VFIIRVNLLHAKTLFCAYSDFRFGLIKPVLKDKNGDITSTDMYRPITLTPVISTLFESVLLQLYGDFLTSDNLQFGFKKRDWLLPCFFSLSLNL